ncbi:hypothetical protein HDU93_000738 [Gonapodya sp. JEL0774]|nr:hypothetical protein HDU93_000738 [Gonapodya sp. JEL0774]
MLIEAIESGSIEAVRAALQLGFSPDQRKTVKLTADVEGVERTDTAPGETPLVLACLYNRPDFIKLLLDAGASVDGPITWKVPNWETNWTSERWNAGRWFAEYRFDSILEVALCCPANVVSPFDAGKTKLTEFVESKRQVALNIDGDPALVTRAREQKDSFHFISIKLNPTIVRSLLTKGVRVTPRCIDRALAMGSEGEALVNLLVEQPVAVTTLSSSGVENPHNVRLIAAVESRQLNDVRAALAAGASPDARKKTTLRAKVEGGKVMSETAWGESALALAVLYAREDIVKELLNAGADVHRLIEWKLPTWDQGDWSTDTWQKNRWLLTYRCASIIDLVTGSPIISSANVDIRDEFMAMAEQESKFGMSKDGAEIQIEHPTTQSEAFDFGGFICNLPILRLLLARGAQVPSRARRAARAMQDQEACEVIEAHIRNLEQRNGNNVRAASLVEEVDYSQVVMTLSEMKKRVAEERIAAQQRAVEHGRIVGDLERELKDVQNEVERLRSQVHDSDRQRIYTPPAPIAPVAPIAVPVWPPLSPNARFGNDQTPSITAPAVPPPMSGLMFAIHEFPGRKPGEVALKAGDRVTCERRTDGWGLGRNLDTNSYGFYPLTHVAPSPAPAPATVVPNGANPFRSVSSGVAYTPSMTIPATRTESGLMSTFGVDVAGPPMRGSLGA